MHLLLPCFSVSAIPVPVCCAATWSCPSVSAVPAPVCCAAAWKPSLPACGALSRHSSDETLSGTPCMGRGSRSPLFPAAPSVAPPHLPSLLLTTSLTKDPLFSLVVCKGPASDFPDPLLLVSFLVHQFIF